MNNLTLVLDNLRSCHNVGSIIRTANGFNCQDFIFLGTTPYPKLKNDQRLGYLISRSNKKIAKTSLGSEKEIRGEYFQNTDDFLEKYAGRNLICLEQTSNSQPLHDFQLPANSYLILGNEIDGVSKNLIESATTCLAIPMLGSKESFNVAIATGIVLYQFSMPGKS